MLTAFSNDGKLKLVRIKTRTVASLKEKDLDVIEDWNGERHVIETFAHWSTSNAQQFPDDIAFVMQAESRTWRSFEQCSRGVAESLKQRGVARNDRVAVLMKNAISFYEILVASQKVGASVVGLNWRLQAEEVGEIVASAKPTLIVYDTALSALLSGLDMSQLNCQKISVEQLLSDIDSQASAPDDVIDQGAVADAPGLILYSSGTTGKPKGVMLTNRNLAIIPQMASDLFRMDRGCTYLLGSPLFHVGGVVTGSALMALGGRTVLLADSDPGDILDAIETYQVTHTFFVPAVIQRLVEEQTLRPRNISNLRMMIYGAAPMYDSLLARAMEVLGCGFLGCYGMTETCGTVTALFPEEHHAKGAKAKYLRSVGRALPWADVKIFDHRTGEPVPAGTFGEIWVRSEANTPGYFNSEAETKQAITDDGWLKTGDGAVMDEEGFIYLKDRIKDMIITGGENVYPAEVENLISQVSGVSQVAVIGLPDQKWGEAVTAVIVAQKQDEILSERVMNFTRERLAHYKCPTSVVFIDEMPRNASGKILKNILRQRFAPTVAP